MIDDKPKEVSKYNEAGLQIMRLNAKWQKIDYLFGKGDLENIKYELDRVWDELVADTSKSQGKNYSYRNQYYRLKITKSKSYEELYENLLNRLRFLKLLQQDVGKGGVYQEEDEDDFE